jgi:hypothetical protein
MAPSSPEIYGSPSVTYSCIQDDHPDDGKVYTGEGNIDDDPLLVDADGPDGVVGTEDDDVRLQGDSPCINTGSNGTLELPEADLDGHSRVLCGQVDMGAYEFGIGDYECDDDVDLGDLAAWEVCMTGPDNRPYVDGCEAFDFEYDRDVDLHDFAGLQAAFTGSGP